MERDIEIDHLVESIYCQISQLPNWRYKKKRIISITISVLWRIWMVDKSWKKTHNKTHSNLLSAITIWVRSSCHPSILQSTPKIHCPKANTIFLFLWTNTSRVKWCCMHVEGFFSLCFSSKLQWPEFVCSSYFSFFSLVLRNDPLRVQVWEILRRYHRFVNNYVNF